MNYGAVLFFCVKKCSSMKILPMNNINACKTSVKNFANVYS